MDTSRPASCRVPRRPTYLRGCRGPSAFTLIELLVVIAILALLVSILLPSLQKAKELAVRTKCLSNIHHLGIGCHMYSSEFGTLPPWNPQRGYLPSINYAPLHYPNELSGLLALQTIRAFNRENLACPEGWCSMGRPDFYKNEDLSNPSTSVNMDYIYWGARFGPRKKYDVRHASFKYKADTPGMKVLITDVVTETSRSNPWPRSRQGFGNHDHGKVTVVDRTDGLGGVIGGKMNMLQASGGSVCFSDGHAVWMLPEQFTQYTSGLCYPPPDQW